jgi:hypothetical protein
MSVAITPETKVGELLDAYPGIEDKLIAWVPAFEKLKNPILRKTVAKVATLEQAARIGGVSVRDLVAKLREATGQGAAPAELLKVVGQDAEERPQWADESRVKFDVDADRMLEAGEHPIGRIKQCVAEASAGDIVRLRSSFHPAPLIDALRRSGLSVWSKELEPGRRVTLIRK